MKILNLYILFYIVCLPAKILFVSRDFPKKSGSSFKNGKVPAVSWSEHPQDYIEYDDKNYGSGVICSHIAELNLHLAVIDLDIPKKEEDIPMKAMLDACKNCMCKTHTKITPSGGYHIYLLSKQKPALKQPPFNMDYQTNTGNSRGKYVVTNFRYAIEDSEGNTINLNEYYKKHGKIATKKLNFIKEYYKHWEDTPDDILVVESSDKVLADILNSLKEQVFYKPPSKFSNKKSLRVINFVMIW